MNKKTEKELARRFLQSGRNSDLSEERLIAVCDSLVRSETQQSSANAVKLGKSFVQKMKSVSTAGILAAYRALGWAHLVHNDYIASERAYLCARELCQRDAINRARIDRILIDVYMYLDDVKEARHRATLAIKTFSRLKEAEELAKTRVNYANLLHRLDRHREANKLYRDGATFFKKRGNPLALALCYYNQANTLVQLFDLESAEPLYKKARKIFEKNDHELWACNCLNGLSWLHMLEGKFHFALQELLDSELGFSKAGQRREVVLCQLDRAQIYFSLNLFTDARNTSREAERDARKLGITYEASKSAFFCARASLGMGRIGEARKSIRRALAGFEKVGNRSFLCASRLLESQILSGSTSAYKDIEFARKGFSRAQLPLWEAICDLQIASDWPEKPAPHRRLASNPAVKAVPYLYARWLTSRGDRQAHAGRISNALKDWTRAANVLDAVRANLPPVELNTAFLRKQPGQPHKKLIGALVENNPRQAAAWSERFRTSGRWKTSTEFSTNLSVRQKAEESLDSLANQVSTLASQLTSSSGDRNISAAKSSPELTRLQHKVRLDLSRISSSGGPIAEIGLLEDQFATSSRQHPIVQFHIRNGDFYAFVHQGKEIKLHRFVEGTELLEEFVACWRFIVEHRVHSGRKTAASEINDERNLLGRMGRWLWAPLDIPENTRVLILPEGPLANLPWQAMLIDGQSLIERNSILMAPSLRHHLHAKKHQSNSRNIEVFVGSTKGMKNPEKDYSRIIKEKSATIHANCRREHWPEESRAAIWHYVGHAELRSDNPFYSSLVLAKERIFAADFLLKKNIVDLVTLAACRSGQQTNLPGEESSGLVRSLLEMGSRNVIASHWAINNRSSASWMDSFYSLYLEDSSLLEAFRQATLTTRNSYPSAYHWAAFSINGAGN